MRHRTKHDLGDDWGVSLKDMKVFNSFAHPELCSTLLLWMKHWKKWGAAKARELGEAVNLVALCLS